MGATNKMTGRCYCGSATFESEQNPQSVVYCHCDDCRRFTGAPVSAFAAFDTAKIKFTADQAQTVSGQPGAFRDFCKFCGSPLASRYDYLPDQTFVPVGIVDQADELQPEIHAYESMRLPWLHINDELTRFEKSSRSHLNQKGIA